MIQFGFLLSNPWSLSFKLLCCRSFALTKNKTIELNLYRTSSIIGAFLDVTAGRHDHVGFSVALHLFGFNVEFSFYDNRHYIFQVK